ncbi:MAG TPA: hypothetical protein VMD05_05645 [Candidatus Nanoarchaeia archaeon]|nr:hypothetical protein [Candidatus Nanoarchaeia archaeon]
MPLSDLSVTKDIAQISAHMKKRDIKYIRNLNRFWNNGNLWSDIYSAYSSINAYWYVTAQQDTGILPSVNIIRSCILTHQSKLSQLKPRPHFSADRGDFETRQLCRTARQHFDNYLDVEDVYNKGAEVIAMADIFEVGGIWVNDNTGHLEILRPWEMGVDALEYQSGEITRCYIYKKQYPLKFVEKYYCKIKKGVVSLTDEEEKRRKFVEFYVYYDLENGYKYYVVNGEVQGKDKISYTCPPWALFWWDKPTKGFFSVSLADDLYTIQREIDLIAMKIHEAFTLSPANAIFIATSDNIKNPGHKLLRAESIDNKVGSVYEFNPSEQTGKPVTVATPPAIDEQYIRMLDYWIEKAYQLTGISKLSAQSEMPKNTQSGLQLETLQNVESERFQTHQDNYRQFYLDLVKTCIEVYPENEKILKFLPKDSPLTWGNLKKRMGQYSIQFTDISNLSKDPSMKLQQVTQLMAMGFITGATAASLLELEDEGMAYQIGAISFEYTQKIISDALNQGKIDFLELGSYDQLLQETVREMMKLKIEDSPPEKLKNLGNLLNAIFEKMNATKETMKGQQFDDAAEGQMVSAALQSKQNELASKLQEQAQELNAPVAAKGIEIQNALQAKQQEDAAPVNQRAQELAQAEKALQPQMAQLPAPQVTGPTGPIPIPPQTQPVVNVHLPEVKQARRRRKVIVNRDERGNMVGADIEELPIEGEQ